MKKESLWLKDYKNEKIQVLNKSLDVDVLIVGGGITGLSIAYQLSQTPLKVALVERNLIGQGVTSRTTGKITYLQELIYSKLENLYSFEVAKTYLQSQKEAKKMIKEIICKENISCDYKEVSSYVFTDDEFQIKAIEKEKELLRKMGVSVGDGEKIPYETDSKYFISVNDTAVFHPIKYVQGLKNACMHRGVAIFENSTFTTFSKANSIYYSQVNSCEISSKYLVFATHFPYFVFPFFPILKCSFEKSYIAAYPVKKANSFSAITSKKPTKSIRYHYGKPFYCLYLTESHDLSAKYNYPSHFNKLLKTIAQEPDYIWSNKDIITYDHLPFVGPLKKDDTTLLIATGFNTWGMTNATISGMVIRDLILGVNNAYCQLFSPLRGDSVSKYVHYPVSIAKNTYSFSVSKVNKNKSWYSKNVYYSNFNGMPIATYKDSSGKEHSVINRCPHLKCGLLFNEVEKTWDCPCHGSRFSIDGKCIEGPSNYNIQYKKDL